MALKGSKSNLYKHNHVAYQIEGNEEKIQWCKYFALGACLGVTRGQKGFWVSFYCYPIPLRLF